MQNKRGQEMSTSTIILLILGIVILVVLIFGFTKGWDKLAPWISSNNVDTIVTACETSCATSSLYDFCMVGRSLKAEDVKLKEVTCNYLATAQPVYGVNTCPSITCDNVVFVEASTAEDLPGFCSENGQIVQALIDDTLVSHECVM